MSKSGNIVTDMELAKEYNLFDFNKCKLFIYLKKVKKLFSTAVVPNNIKIFKLIKTIE